MALVVLSGALPGCMIYSDRQRRRTMNYYTAPWRASTDRIWRQAHQRWFGAPGALPAIMPLHLPAREPGAYQKEDGRAGSGSEPRCTGHPPAAGQRRRTGRLDDRRAAKMGYTEVNLNFGCPSGTVTAKGKGAGMLRDLSKLEAFLDEVFSQAEGPSRSRPGWASPARRSSKPSSTSTTAAPSVS